MVARVFILWTKRRAACSPLLIRKIRSAQHEAEDQCAQFLLGWFRLVHHTLRTNTPFLRQRTQACSTPCPKANPAPDRGVDQKENSKQKTLNFFILSSELQRRLIVFNRLVLVTPFVLCCAAELLLAVIAFRHGHFLSLAPSGRLGVFLSS